MMTTTTSSSSSSTILKNNHRSSFTGPVHTNFALPRAPLPDCPPPASAYVLETLQHWAYPPFSSNDQDKESTSPHPWGTCQICQDVDDKDEMNPSCGSSCLCCGPSEKNTSKIRKEETTHATALPKTKLIMMTQLPCGHVYHTACISHWLLECQCTCPVCRYELPTDDMIFEMDREERMAARKVVSLPLPTTTTRDSTVWLPQPGRKQAILRQLDLTTSTTPAMHWCCGPAADDDMAQDKRPATVAAATSATKISHKNLDVRTPNTCVVTANTAIASSA